MAVAERIGRDALAVMVGDAYSYATPFAKTSREHGPRHWRDVAWLGLNLIDLGVPADPAVVVLFAALHDTQRWADHDDPGHGERAALQMIQLGAQGRLRGVSGDQLASLGLVLALHPLLQASNDVTRGACLDADRATLWRVGTEPRRRFFSHPEYAETLIEAGRGRVGGPDLSWGAVLDFYASLGG